MVNPDDQAIGSRKTGLEDHPYPLVPSRRWNKREEQMGDEDHVEIPPGERQHH